MNEKNQNPTMYVKISNIDNDTVYIKEFKEPRSKLDFDRFIISRYTDETNSRFNIYDCIINSNTKFENDFSNLKKQIEQYESADEAMNYIRNMIGGKEDLFPTLFETYHANGYLSLQTDHEALELFSEYSWNFMSDTFKQTATYGFSSNYIQRQM